MDIMDKVNELVETITKNKALMESFKKDPVKVIKDLVKGLDLDEDTLAKLAAAVKGKIDLDKLDLDKLDLDKAGDLLGGLKKLF